MDQDTHSSREKSHDVIGMRFKEAVRASQTANDMFDDVLTQFLGINRTDGRCLDIIDRQGRITAGQLATESGLTTGAVTAVVDRLERQGYVRRVREEADRRKVHLEVTERCREISWHIFGHFARISPILTARFSPEQVRGIIQFLEMGSHLNRQMAAVLAQYTEPSNDSTDWRLDRAKAFEQAAVDASPRINKELESILRSVEAEL